MSCASRMTPHPERPRAPPGRSAPRGRRRAARPPPGTRNEPPIACDPSITSVPCALRPQHWRRGGGDVNGVPYTRPTRTDTGPPDREVATMDDEAVRARAQAVCDALAAGDIERASRDFSPE